jgi:hypothetical protein
MNYNKLRLRIHEILTYAVQQWGFDEAFDKQYHAVENFGIEALTKYGSIDLTFHFGDIDLNISTDKHPTFFLRDKNFASYPIQRVRPWPTPENPNSIITDDGVILHIPTTEYNQYLERLLDELSSESAEAHSPSEDRCFEWIDRIED